MRKRLWLSLGGLLLLAILIATCVPVLVPPAPGVTYANFSRIETGMTRDEVAELLGKPDVVLMRDDVIVPPLDFNQKIAHECDVWNAADGSQASVHCNAEGRIEAVHWNGWSDERNGLEKLRDRVPWLAQTPPRLPRPVALDVR